MIAWLNKQKSSVTILCRHESLFLMIIGALVVFAYFVSPYPHLAMWFGFAIAGYSAIANDSIQTLGTFLSSNTKMRWWVLWLFIGGIMVATYIWGWTINNGDIAFHRLDRIPQPTTFSFITVAAPIILLILTKLKMPVSTTFLLLSAFSSAVVIQQMLIKTLFGYLIAFGIGLTVWGVIAYRRKREFKSKTYNKKVWRILQACSTSLLWWAWLMQDTANVAVFLPRSLSLNQVLIAVGYLFLVIGLIMFWRGGGIQTIVTEKTDVVDVRAATAIDFIYAIVLLIFKFINNVPMSTTWVFLGLLAGREISLTLLSKKKEPYRTTAKLVLRDILRASAGLAISLIIVVFLM